MTIHYRHCRGADAEEVINVCYRTGFMGEDLTGTGRFNDIRLFGFLFCLYYVLYEPETSFVAVDSDSEDRVVGYILGTADAAGQGRGFNRTMMPRILARLFLYTWWRHHESFAEVMYWNRHRPEKTQTIDFNVYPAHLHIDILPEYQRRGIGRELMTRFEERLRVLEAGGVYLETSNHNTKALGFYRKRGFTILSEEPGIFWSGVDDYRSVVLGKLIQ